MTEDRVSVELFLWQRRMDEATDRCRGETWQFGPTANPISTASYLPELHTVATPTDGANLLARYRAIPRLVDQTIANLRVGLAEGRVATAHSTRLSIDMADRELAKPLQEWPLLAPAGNDHPDWPAGELAAGPVVRREVQVHVGGGEARAGDGGDDGEGAVGAERAGQHADRRQAAETGFASDLEVSP